MSIGAVDEANDARGDVARPFDMHSSDLWVPASKAAGSLAQATASKVA
jgi:hypothetical protein